MFSFQFDTVISKAIIITIYRELFVPVFFLPLSPSLSMCEFKTRRNALAQIISFYEKTVSLQIQDGANVFAYAEGQI